MPAWLPAAIAGGASLLGGALGNRAARNESRRNRRFQERMSSTAWQRGVADMEAAGLNPALAYGAGGASTPGGSMASQSDVVSPAVNSAMAANMQRKQLQAIDTAIKKDIMVTARERATANKEQTQAHLNESLERNADVQNRLIRLQVPWAEASAKAIERFPQAELFKLIMQSGGGALIGGITGLGSAALLRRGATQISKTYNYGRSR